MRQAEEAERKAEPAVAVDLYRRALAVTDESRLARRARVRLAWLEARSEDGFRPLASLMRFSRLERSAIQRDELDAFAAEVERFPPGQVRRESQALAADHYLHRFHDAAQALDLYRRLSADPGASDAERRMAEGGAALAAAELAGPGESLAGLERAGLGHSALATRLRVARLIQVGRPLALAVVAAFVLAAAVCGAFRGIRPRLVLRSWDAPRLGLAALLLVPPPLALAFYDRRVMVPAALIALAGAFGVLLSTIVGAGLQARTTSSRRLASFSAAGAAATLALAFLAATRGSFLVDLALAIEQTP
jgi:hypothetical protein